MGQYRLYVYICTLTNVAEHQRFFYIASKIVLKENRGNKKIARRVIKLVEKHTSKWRCDKIRVKCSRVELKSDEYFKETDYHLKKDCIKKCKYFDITDLSIISGINKYLVSRPIKWASIKLLLKGKKEKDKIKGRIQTLIFTGKKEQIKKINTKGWLIKNFPNVKTLIIKSNDKIDFKLLPQIDHLVFENSSHRDINTSFNQNNLPENLVSLRLGSVNSTTLDDHCMLGVGRRVTERVRIERASIAYKRRDSYNLKETLSNLPESLKSLYLNVFIPSREKFKILTELPPNIDKIYIRSCIRDSSSISNIQYLKGLKNLTINGYMSPDPINFLPDGLVWLSIMVGFGNPLISLPESLKHMVYVEGPILLNRGYNRSRMDIPENEKYINFPQGLQTLKMDMRKVIGVSMEPYKYFNFPLKIKTIEILGIKAVTDEDFIIPNIPKGVKVIRNIS